MRCQQYAKARMMMRREIPKIPKLRLDLLLYTNMGTEAPKWQPDGGNLVTVGINDKPANTTNAIGWAHSTSPRMNITTAPAGRQGPRRRRRMEGSERVTADIDRVG